MRWKQYAARGLDLSKRRVDHELVVDLERRPGESPAIHRADDHLVLQGAEEQQILRDCAVEGQAATVGQRPHGLRDPARHHDGAVDQADPVGTGDVLAGMVGARWLPVSQVSELAHSGFEIFDDVIRRRDPLVDTSDAPPKPRRSMPARCSR